jgi:hypothetical protein
MVAVHSCRAGRRERLWCAAAVCLGRERKSRAAAFPSGDLPEVPGGGRFLARPMSRRPEPVCNGVVQLFSAAGAAAPALHRETK